MAKRKTKKKLVDAPDEMAFWVHDGPVLKNLKELLKAARKMNKEIYSHHVNKQKNDFSKWIKDVLGHKSLANALEKVKTKKEFIKTLQKEVSI